LRKGPEETFDTYKDFASANHSGQSPTLGVRVAIASSDDERSIQIHGRLGADVFNAPTARGAEEIEAKAILRWINYRQQTGF
jgi:hypothetical protein